MNSEITIDAVRMALGMYELQARLASINVANAHRPGAPTMRVEFGQLQDALADVAGVGTDDSRLTAVLARAQNALDHARPTPAAISINLDEEVADMVAATTRFQTLTEALNRRFGLMRLAISGRG